MNNLNEMTDEELAIMYQEGNNKAFDELLLRKQQKLYSYIIFVVRNKEIADDIFQETFVRVITQLKSGKYANTGKFGAWLICIAHNAIMDLYREQRVHREIYQSESSDLMAQLGDMHIEESIEADYINNQVLSQVHTLMDKLPATQREVVYMHYYQQIPFKEIAQLTNVSINTALGRMRYALLNLRRMARKHNISLQLV